MPRTIAIAAVIVAGVLIVALIFDFFDNEYPEQARLPGSKVKIEESQSPDLEITTGSVRVDDAE